MCLSDVGKTCDGYFLRGPFNSTSTYQAGRFEWAKAQKLKGSTVCVAYAIFPALPCKLGAPGAPCVVSQLVGVLHTLWVIPLYSAKVRKGSWLTMGFEGRRRPEGL